MTGELPAELKYDPTGLIPAIAQDAETGEVLMHAYMNREAVARSLETGLAHYYSRSRDRLWQKGEESGHVQRIREVRYDCDADTLLLRVEQVVAACHTGHRSCFYRSLTASGAAGEGASARRFDPAAVYVGLGVLAKVYGTIQDRQTRPRPGSYVASLFAAGPDRIRSKVAEEAGEALQASAAGERGALVSEVADLWFHSLVLLAHHDIRPEEVAAELGRRAAEGSGEA